MAAKTKKSKVYDPSKYLDSAEAIAEYISEAFLTHDQKAITRALGEAAKARGMTEIAEQSGLSRESLYKALSADGNPELDTVLRVIEALGVDLQAKPSEEPEPKEREYA